jgi:predicted  nucleic acid-binding Zn-ribbon protein
VHQAEESAKETDKWADEEFSTLSKKMDELRELRKEAVTKYQRSQIEVEDLKQQISRTANTYSNFEDKLQEKVRRIQILEKQLKSLKENTIDVAVHEELQDRIQALTGEAKHWQQKAQSLSKEMHRAMSLQMDYNKKKDEIHKLEKKIEVR